MQAKDGWGWHWLKVLSENVYYAFCFKTNEER